MMKMTMIILHLYLSRCYPSDQVIHTSFLSFILDILQKELYVYKGGKQELVVGATDAYSHSQSYSHSSSYDPAHTTSSRRTEADSMMWAKPSCGYDTVIQDANHGTINKLYDSSQSPLSTNNNCVKNDSNDEPNSVLAQLEQIWETVQLQAVWKPMAFVYIYNIMQIPNVAWQSFLQLSLDFEPWILVRNAYFIYSLFNHVTMD